MFQSLKRNQTMEEIKLLHQRKIEQRNLMIFLRKRRILLILLRNKNDTTTSKESTNEEISNIEDLPLIERVRLK